ncbi:MAG: alpha/beta hydrolase, partial [Rudaea sp.]
MRTTLLLAVAALLISAAGFAAWGSTPQQAMPEALASLRSDQDVEVQTEPWIAFEPAARKPATGLIIYPGGHVDARAYAPAARAIAAQGYLAVIVPMPLSLAFLGADRAAQVM